MNVLSKGLFMINVAYLPQNRIIWCAIMIAYIGFIFHNNVLSLTHCLKLMRIIDWLLTSYLYFPSGVKEYCSTEIFEISCGEGEAIMMYAATFGRMQPGRCISGEYLSPVTQAHTRKQKSFEMPQLISIESEHLTQSEPSGDRSICSDHTGHPYGNYGKYGSTVKSHMTNTMFKQCKKGPQIWAKNRVYTRLALNI